MAIKWNQAEDILRDILVNLCGGEGLEIWILTAELGAVSLENALKSASNDIAKDKLKPYIDHAVEWFSRLREYRNYYVHGIKSVTFSGDLSPIGVIGQTAAKTRIVIHRENVTLEAIIIFLNRISDFMKFCSDLEFHVAATSLKVIALSKPLPPLPQMPLLPDRLQKPRQYPQGGPPQPSP